MSALVEFFTSDPGDQVLEDATKINIIESIASIRRLVGGSGTVIMFGDVVNDRGQPEVPVVLENGLADLARLYGGFQHWMGLSLDTVGATTGYNGNLFAQTKGLSAPKIVLVPINAEVRNAGGTALTAEFTRGLGTGDFVMPAGTRFYAAPGGYELATLEDVTWAGAGGAQSVRFRQVSGEGEPAVDISTVTTLNPADVTWDNTVEDRKSTRLNSSHSQQSRMPSSA